MVTLRAGADRFHRVRTPSLGAKGARQTPETWAAVAQCDTKLIQHEILPFIRGAIFHSKGKDPPPVGGADLVSTW